MKKPELTIEREVATESICPHRDWNTLTVGELLQILGAAKGRIHSYNGFTKTLERLRRAIDGAFI